MVSDSRRCLNCDDSNNSLLNSIFIQYQRMNMLRITNEIHIKRYPAKTLRIAVYNEKCEIGKVVSPGRSKVYFDKPQNIERAFLLRSRHF